MVLESVTITVELPAETMRKAKASGILSPATVSRLIERELLRQEDEQYINQVMDALHALPDRPTPEEIDEEIHAYRAEKRAKRAHRD